MDQPQSWRHIYRAEGNYVANRFVKERLVNNGLLDAVLYLGEYRPFVQVPFLLTLCRVVTDDLAERRLAEGASRESHGERGGTDCTGKIGEPRPLADERIPVHIISHSLGTRIVFDGLGLIAKPDFLQQMVASLEAGDTNGH